MGHRYKVREIAQQSGLSEATVDRVLNDRPGRPGEHPRRGHAGHRRPGQTAGPAAPQRQALPRSTWSCRRRSGSPMPSATRWRPSCRRSPRRCCGRGSICGRADRPRPRSINSGGCGAATASSSRRPTSPRWPRRSTRLVDAGIPVVTYATDVPDSARCGYVGIDNHAAGVTAAYLMRQWLGRRSPPKC